LPYDSGNKFSEDPGHVFVSGDSFFQIVVTFAVPITFTSASVSETGSVATALSSGNQAFVNLTGVTNAQRITVMLTGVNDGTHTADVSVPMAVLLGDTNADGLVNSADISQTKSQSGNAVTGSNFREDLNADGFINSADISLVKSKSGTALP
jgi:Dockerin type I domain